MNLLSLVFCVATLALLSAVASADDTPPARRAVVLSTDIGASIDDQWALVHLVLSPQIDLQGVVTSHSPNLKPPAAETAANVARDVLAHVPLATKPPVFAGSSDPLLDRKHSRDNAGVEFLRDQARSHPPRERLVVLLIGPATDVASALLLEPALAERIEVVAMAFDGWPDGGDPWNVKHDLAAWQVLIESRVPIVVGDVAVTTRSLILTRQQSQARFANKGEAGAYLEKLLIDRLDRDPATAKALSGSPDAWPIWDEVASAHLLGLTKTETHPRPALRDDMTFGHPRTQGTIEWITSIDSAKLWDDLERKLERAQK
jgi:inosine-uridine nucleoside N-ribohydrolase